MSTVELKYPIQVKTSNGNLQSISSITIGRIKAKHLKLLPKGLNSENAEQISAAEMFPLIAAVAGLSESEVDEIDATDLPAITEAFVSAMGELNPQQTGEKL